MKRIFLLSILLLFVGEPRISAEGPDDQYVLIYRLIQEGDQLNASGQADLARERYLEAQDGLKRIQTGHPGWNVNVIDFRLHYVTEKLGAIPLQKPAATIRGKPSPAPITPSASLLQPPGAEEKDTRIRSLQEEVRRLEAGNSILEAKLKEALSAQPAAVDPRELARAEEKIKGLEKEKELFRVTLEQEQAKQPKQAVSVVVDDLTKKLAEASAQLTRQSQAVVALSREKEILEARLEVFRKENEAAQVLRNENEMLRKQLAENKTVSGVTPKIETPPPRTQPSVAPKPVASEAGEVARLQAALRTLQDEKAALERTKKELEMKLARGLSTPAKTSSVETEKVRLLESERDELLKKLNETTKQIYDNRTRTEQVQREQNDTQLAGLRARLEALEAQKVPYTPEELALFKPPSLTASKPDPKAGKKGAHELPGGAAPLLAEAERAFESRRFDEAEKKYLQVLRLDDKNVLTLANLAASQLEQNRIAEAEANVRKALAQEPTDAYSLSLLGILKFRQEKFDDALDALSRAAQLDPRDPKTQNYLGITLSQKGQRGAAEAALRRAIQLAPAYGGAHHNLAVIYATQQPPFTELARWHYQKALASGHPQNPELERIIEAAKPVPGTK